MDGKAIKYPIYIVSKGRWENPLTARYFIQDGITDFNIVVEPQEYDNYCKAVGANRVLKTDFSNLGLGSYPARNFAWEHSIKNGFEKHLLFDDNIRGFSRLNNGQRRRCNGIFKAHLLRQSRFKAALRCLRTVCARSLALLT